MIVADEYVLDAVTYELLHEWQIELYEPWVVWGVLSGVLMALVQDPDQSEPAKLLLLEGLERLETPLFTDLVSREGRSDKECLQPFLHAGNELVVSKLIHVVDVAEILLH